MSDLLDITDAEAAGLCELAALDLAMAKDFAARAQAAEDPAVANELARSYQRMARSYRQTLALKAKLQRDRAEALKAAPKPKPSGQAIAKRIRELRGALVRVAWDEVERLEVPEDDGYDRDVETFAWRHEDIEGVITEECLKDSFCDEALDDHVARLCLSLDFDPITAERWRDLPDPPQDALDLPVDDGFPWRSSA